MVFLLHRSVSPASKVRLANVALSIAGSCFAVPLADPGRMLYRLAPEASRGRP
jgi:hypothetical protein